jgi:hypothetical protein
MLSGNFGQSHLTLQHKIIIIGAILRDAIATIIIVIGLALLTHVTVRVSLARV